MKLVEGTYENLITKGLKQDMQDASSQGLVCKQEDIDSAESPNMLTEHLSKIIRNRLADENLTAEERAEFANRLIDFLGEETLKKLEQGIKDDTIRYIEDKYNNGSSPMFNVQFTCESEFVAWVEKRVEKFGDESTRKLLEAYHNNK